MRLDPGSASVSAQQRETTFTAVRPSLASGCRSGASPYLFEDEDDEYENDSVRLQNIPLAQQADESTYGGTRLAPPLNQPDGTPHVD
jgi:hypothetical protein